MDENLKRPKPSARRPRNRPHPPAEASPPVQPPASDPIRTKALDDARRLKNMFVPAALATLLGPEVGALGAKFYLDVFQHNAGNPTDPVERILLEQLALSHVRLARLYLQIESVMQSPEHLRILHGAAHRLLGEVRRLALAIRAYRLPPSNRSFAVIAQQNVVASGSQSVEYTDQSTTGSSKVHLKAHDHPEVADNQEQPRGDRINPAAEESPAGSRRPRERLEAATLG